VYKIEPLVAMSGFYALLILAFKMKPSLLVTSWAKYIISGVFTCAGLLIMPDAHLSKMIWLVVMLPFAGLPFFCFNKEQQDDLLRPIFLVSLWVAWICSYFSIQIPLAPYRWILGLLAVAFIIAAAEPSRLKTILFYYPKSRLLIALTISFAAVGWLPFSLSEWGMWVRYGQDEMISGALHFSFLSSWFFIAAFSWLMWPFLFSWAESLSDLNSSILVLLCGLQLPLSLACFFILPMLGEHYPQMYKTLALGSLLSAIYALIRALIFVHYKKLIIYLYSAMTALIISGTSLQLFTQEASFSTIVEWMLLKQAVLFICLILTLSIHRFIPANKPLIQELKTYVSKLHLTFARSTILLMLALGVGNYFVTLSKSLGAGAGWNIALIGGSILIALISFRLAKVCSAYMK
jgi:hypothetical protein